MAEIRLRVFLYAGRNGLTRLPTALIAVGVALILIPLPVLVPFVDVPVGTFLPLAGLFVRLFGV